MDTDQLIAMLARDPQPVAPGAVRRRYVRALGWGAAGAMLIMMARLGFRPDLATAVMLPMFWVKLALPLSLAVIALVGVARLARPGVALGRAGAAACVPVLGIWALAAATLLAAAPGERISMLLGLSWSTCPFNIALLSAPVFAGIFWAMKGLAPTRLVLAGGFSGLLAGATGAVVYCLHCPEMSPAFIGTWYLLGMSIPTLAGALAGPRLLRW
jgi:hypothetical protein